MNHCLVISFNRMAYNRAWDLQKRLHQQVVEGALPNLLLLLEHPHVYTLGRRGKSSDILVDSEKLSTLGVEVHYTDRGGEVTYHGPGQLIGYPIVNLRAWGGGPLKYVQTLEETLIATLAEFGVRGASDSKPTGVWVGNAKIAAIGVKVSRGSTLHGFALNVDPDLSYFDHIVPCGMPESRVTSVASERSGDISVREVMPVLARKFGEAFGMDVEWATLERLTESSLLGDSHLQDSQIIH